MDKSTISTSELKAKCSQIVKGVARKRTAVVITRHGRPIARLIPIEEEKPESLFGFAAGKITINGDIIEPIDVSWEANE